MSKPKVLVLDIENSHNIGAFFQLRDDNGIPHGNILKERAIFCASWKWLGEKQVYSTCVKPSDVWADKQVCKDISNVVNTADGMLAHFGTGHDFPFINSRLVYHGLPPVAPVVKIDTYRIAKAAFKFNSNRLDYLGQYLGCGNKLHTSPGLWLECLKGKPRALKEMVRYNVMDVKLLEPVYKKLAPFVPAKVNAALFGEKYDCPNCGSGRTEKRGFSYTRTGKKQRVVCKDCGHWSHDIKGTLR